jgi:hypothetical protein
MKYRFLNLHSKTALRRPFDLIFLIFFMGYIGFIPTGPYPVILWGVKLDHLFALGTALFSFFLFRFKWPRGLRPVYFSVLLFLSIAFITTASSSHLDSSFRGFMVSLGYATIALLTPLLIHDRVVIIRWYLLLVASITGLFILYLYFFVRDAGRLHLYSTVDPNMTSVGLLMSIIIFLPEYLKRKKSYFIVIFSTLVFNVLLAIILAAVICLLSRTAVFSFLIALSWGGFCVIVKKKAFSYRAISLKICIVVIACILGFVSLKIIRPSIISNYSHRITRIFQGSLASPEKGRLRRAEKVLDKWSEDPKIFILGEGYFTINPHNEFLRMLGGSGLFGFISFLVMFLVFYHTCCRSRSSPASYLFCQNALFVYIVTMVQFYGHTKSLWVGLTFLLLNYIVQKTLQPPIQNRRSQQMTTV